MNRATRFATTLSTLAIAATLTGCAADRQGRTSALASKADMSNIGLAIRAQAALGSQQFTTAIGLAERAVQNSPNEAELRTLLGNCYFAGGRFASAEAAYRDSLTLSANQPKVMLKLALVEIAQGKNDQARSVLETARGSIDIADYGLAVALAGAPEDAVAVLNQAARTPSADSRVRQNLALAYGLSGDWTMARTVASQDVSPDQLDSRIQQWMAMASPTRASEQVAALTGVHPVADPGMPQQLALNPLPANQAYAEAQVPQPQPQIAPVQPQVAEIPAVAPPALPEPAPQIADVEHPSVVAHAVQALVQPQTEAPVVEAVAPKPELPTRFEEPVKAADYVAITDTVRRAAERNHKASGRSNAVVQLGAYSSPERVSVAWNRITAKYPALRSYKPMKARFNGPNGTVWRLSIKGFGSQKEAQARCEQLQNRGGNCFVRTVAGDAPVQLASR
jgi:Flp pilus assembly protein TadD